MFLARGEAYPNKHPRSPYSQFPLVYNSPSFIFARFSWISS